MRASTRRWAAAGAICAAATVMGLQVLTSHAAAAPVAPQTGAGGPHELPVPLANMTAAQWESYLDGVDFALNQGTLSGARGCRGLTKESTSCRLRISPVRNAHTLRYADGAKRPNGTVVAIIENVGTRDEKNWKIPSRHRVLWVVQGANRYTLVDMDASFAPVKTGTFTLCDSNVNTKTSAKFSTCSRSHADPTSRVPSFVHLNPPWITCAEGCCNASMT